MSIISVYITFPDEQSAQKMVDALLNEKMIACGNIFPIQSVYEWQDTIQSEKEFVSLVKTSATLWEKMIQFIEGKHPYDVPCIVRYDVVANKSYENWVLKTVSDA